jgi:hypothetical protein
MKHAYDRSGIYAIHIAGRLDTSWSERLGGMSVTYQEDEGQDNDLVSILYGPLPDQAALLGVLNALYNARYPLLSVRYLRNE